MDASNDRLAALLAALPDLIFRFDVDGHYLEVHSNDDSQLAVPREQALGRRLDEVLTEDVAPGVARLLGAAVSDVASDGQPRSVTYELAVRGEQRTYEARVARISAEEVMAVVRDITDLRRAETLRVMHEQELLRQQSELERVALLQELERASRIEAVGYLAATTAHDVNNLLGAINNYASSIARTSTEWEVRRDAQEVSNAVARGAELTQRLLRIGRRRPEQRRVESVSALVRGLADGLGRGLGMGGAQLVTELPDDEAANVLGLRARLEQAVMNLVINANDAMTARGCSGVISLSVEVRRIAGEDWRPGRLGDRDYVVVAVTDTGGGIPDQVRPRVFEPFFSTKDGDNSGLGLPIVREVAQQHGGGVGIHTVFVDGQRGARIELWLPAASAGPSTRPSEGITVLVVDDDRDVLRSTRHLLEHLGHRVLEAESPALALSILHGEPAIDVVLSDVRMPTDDGVELIRVLRTEWPDVRVAFVTGYSNDLAGLEDLRDVPVLAKPYQADDLVRLIETTAA